MTPNVLDAIRRGNPELARVPEHYVFIIGELARISEVEPKTIRFYEKIGLLKPARQGKFRVFKKRDAENLILIKTLRRYGLSTQLIKELLQHDSRESTGDSKVQPHVVLRSQLDEMQRQRDELSHQIAFLSQLLGIDGSVQNGSLASYHRSEVLAEADHCRGEL
jgi:DNA-binding transcriptional MerR regulator